MCIGGWNVEGVRPNRSDKLAQIGVWLRDEGVDLLGLSETWWAENDAVAPRGYDVLAGEVVRPRQDSTLARRGVALLFRKDLSVTGLADNREDCPFLLGARVHGRAGGVLHVAVFYAEGVLPEVADREFACLRAWIKKYSRLGEVVVVGDFNTRLNGARLEALLEGTGMVDAGRDGPPTTKLLTRLDYTLATPGLVRSHRVDRCSAAATAVNSYHFPTVAQLAWSPAPAAGGGGAVARGDPPLRTAFRWRQAEARDQQRFAEAVAAGVAAISADEKVDAERWQVALGEVLQKAAAATVGVSAPAAERKTRGPSRAVEQLVTLANRMQRAAAKARARGLDAAEQRIGARRFKSMAKLLARSQDDQRLERLAERMTKDGTRSMWAYVVAATRLPSQVPTEVLNAEGAMVTEEARLEAMRDFWAKVTNPALETTSERQRVWVDQVHERFVQAAMVAPVDEAHELSAPITVEEVAAVIKALDIRKAGGPDGAQSFMLKWAADTLIPELTGLFNLCWHAGRIPQGWREAWVTLVHKRSGTRADPSSYRPISLLALVGRLLSAVINKRLYGMLEARGLLVDNQFGFRRNRGCPEAVLTLREVCELRRLNLQPTWLCFIDVAKAYDTVWRDALFVKLFDLVGKPRLWSLLVDWYANDRSRIVAEGRASSWWTNSAGVKQGDVCSPLLYSVFIGDVVAALRERNLGVLVSDRLRALSALLYADDQVLIANSPQDLQDMMDVVAEYAERWQFHLNAKKSAVMVYGGSHRVYPLRVWWLAGNLVQECASYRYLGVIIQADGGFEEQVKDLLSRGQRRLGALRHRFLRGGRLPGGLGRVLIMAHMFGILEYGAAIWSCALPSAVLMDKVEALWKRSGRAVLGARSFTHGAAVLGDLDLLPLQIRRAVLVAALYHKVAAAPRGSIVAEVFWARRHQFQAGAHLPRLDTWLQQVEGSLRLLGLSEHFLQLEESDLAGGPLSRVGWFAKVRAGARMAMVTWWRSELDRHAPHTDLLRRLCPEGPRRQRYIESRAGRLKGFLAEMRAGSLPLRAGAPSCRHARFDAKAGDDLCRLCGNEDESLVHFLFRCPALEPLRQQTAALPFWSRVTPDLDGVAKVLSGFSGAPLGFVRLTGCWFRMWRFREDCLRLPDDESFALRWPGLFRARAYPVIVLAASAAEP